MSEFGVLRCSGSALEIGGPDTPLPTEFRIFKVGDNPTTKGNLVWDAEAARVTMAAYQREGVDLMIDLNHDSVDEEARLHRSDAQDARGWFRPELRNGELWATNVTWTPDGAERLRAKKQRYTSPIAFFDKATRRVVYLANIALVAMPATLQAEPLVAASKTPRVAEQSAACKTLIALLAKHLGKPRTPARKYT